MEPSPLSGARSFWNTRRIAPGVLILAIAVLTGLLLLPVPYPRAHLQGWVEKHLRRGKPEAALQAADQLVKHDPGDPKAWFLRARALFALGKDRECDEALDKALVNGYDGALVDRLRGFLRLRQKRYAEAEPLLVGAMSVRQTIRDPELDEALARVFLQTYKMDLASRVLAKWRADAPEDARPYLWQTEVDRRTGAEPSLIESHYRDALSRDPSLLDARCGLADVLSERKQFDMAEAEYATYLAAKPDDVAVLIRAAHNDMERGDDASASLRLKHALEIDPISGAGLRELGKIELRANRPKEALAALDRAVQSEPYEIDGRYLHSLALDRLGRSDEAKAERQVVNRLREEEARLQALRDTLNRNPRDDRVRLAIARWLFDHGQEDEGVRWVRTVLASAPSDGEAHRMMAEHFQRAGDAALANFHRLQAGVDESPRQPAEQP